ncbi:DUF4350 domain-containing protein [Pedobacter arcticus]|uniref:DUF4350 domain-containing protein n=1 Tax=Pedobacter arcticus TaxID=752140 RepID=UPI0002EB35C9|nr:DUF4350 domain-containing protein [Pedobacter arcticus]
MINLKFFTSVLMASFFTVAHAQTVTLDYYFNRETKKDVSGEIYRFHYLWEDAKMTGFSMWGDVFKKYGAQINSLETAPTLKSLANTDVYIIVDPDRPEENPNPNYIENQHIKAIAKWVKKGGVLVLMANDSTNVELKHFNKLAGKFGVTFTHNRNMVKDKNFLIGKIDIPAGNEVFPKPKAVYLKEISAIAVKQPATALISDKGDVIMAVAKYGKGTVFAVGDPWIYNEYVDGKRIPKEYENYNAMEELSKWLIKQVPVKRK